MRRYGVAWACLAGYLLGAAAWVVLVYVGLGVVWDPRRPQDWPGVAGAIVLGSEYGYEFALVTTHVWGAVGALLAFAVARRSYLAARVTGVLFGFVCLALLLVSVRWVGFEVVKAIHTPGGWDPRDFFHAGVDRGMVLGVPLAFLAAVAWRRWRSRPADREGA